MRQRERPDGKITAVWGGQGACNKGLVREGPSRARGAETGGGGREANPELLGGTVS